MKLNLNSLGIIWIAAIVLSAISLLLGLSYRIQADSSAVEDQAVINVISHLITDELEIGNNAKVKSYLNSFRRSIGRTEFVCLTLKDGSLIYLGNNRTDIRNENEKECRNSSQALTSSEILNSNGSYLGTLQAKMNRSIALTSMFGRISVVIAVIGIILILGGGSLTYTRVILKNVKLIGQSQGDVNKFLVKEFEDINAKLLQSFAERNQLAAYRSLSQMTQMLAHDVRKPFSMLKMILESVSYAKDPIEGKEIAQASLPEVNQAMATVEGMIQDVMQIGSNSKPNQEVAACEAIIDAAVNELFRIFPEADVGIEYTFDHQHCLFIDTIRVGRVFSNILVNAVQAINGKGSLWIKTHEEKGFVEFRIGNDGSFIPKESLPKLFDAFFTSGKKGGTGLGLAIAQKVVNEHGGSIRCESDQTQKYPAGYVEFTLTLPVASELSPNRHEPLPVHSRVIHEQLLMLKKKDSDSGDIDDIEQESIITKRLNALSGGISPVLIVDDEAVYRNSLAGLLTNFRGGKSEVAKIPIVFAKNAEEAMQMVKKYCPFLIIQDIDLGVGSKNGIDVIKDLRQDGFRGRICVHSNRFLFDDQKTASDAGADSVLPKPMSRAHFFKLISSSLTIEAGAIAEPAAPEKNESKKPRIAYIDDAITFTLSWKMKLRDKVDVETFSSTTSFFKKVQDEKDLLKNLDLIVTDYYFGADDPLNGKSFAAELRKLGYQNPIFLASSGDFSEEDFKPDLDGVIGKEVPAFDTLMLWLGRSS